MSKDNGKRNTDTASGKTIKPEETGQNAGSDFPVERPDIISNAEKYGIDIVGLDIIEPSKYTDSKWPIARSLF